MNTTTHRQLSPTPRDAAIARSSGQVLAHYARTQHPLRLRVGDHQQETPIELPTGAVKLLIRVLETMADGRGVTVIPEGAELTTVQAAERLECLAALLDQASGRKLHSAPEGRQAPPCSHGGCHGIQGGDRPGTRTGSRPVDARCPGEGPGVSCSVTRYTGLLDANVLYSAPIRDIFLQLAVRDVFRGNGRRISIVSSSQRAPLHRRARELEPGCRICAHPDADLPD